MLCPNRASGRSSRWRRAAKIWSAYSGMLSMPGSCRRVWRPRVLDGQDLHPGREGRGDREKKLAEPPACGRQTSRTALSGEGRKTLTHFSNCAVAPGMPNGSLSRRGSASGTGLRQTRAEP